MRHRVDNLLPFPAERHCVHVNLLLRYFSSSQHNIAGDFPPVGSLLELYVSG